MSDTEATPEPMEPVTEPVAPPLPVTETVAEQSPPHSNPPPVEPMPVVARDQPDMEDRIKAFFAGWPKTFFHPVHGSKLFEDPNEHAQAGDDWRFESAGEADSARTQTEAELVVLKRQQAMLAAYEANAPVARSSAQAEESAATGYPEPGLS